MVVLHLFDLPHDVLLLVTGSFSSVIVLDNIPRLLARSLYSLDDTGAMGNSVFGPADGPVLDMVTFLVVSHFCLVSLRCVRFESNWCGCKKFKILVCALQVVPPYMCEDLSCVIPDVTPAISRNFTSVTSMQNPCLKFQHDLTALASSLW